jgi:hypothetical protein
MGIATSSFFSSISETPQVVPETTQANLENSTVIMPRCIDCQAPLKHVGDAYCGLTCYGKWFIREQYRMEGEEPPTVQLEDGPVRLSVGEFTTCSP